MFEQANLMDMKPPPHMQVHAYSPRGTSPPRRSHPPQQQHQQHYTHAPVTSDGIELLHMAEHNSMMHRGITIHAQSPTGMSKL